MKRHQWELAELLAGLVLMLVGSYLAWGIGGVLLLTGFVLVNLAVMSGP